MPVGASMIFVSLRPIDGTSIRQANAVLAVINFLFIYQYCSALGNPAVTSGNPLTIVALSLFLLNNVVSLFIVGPTLVCKCCSVFPASMDIPPRLRLRRVWAALRFIMFTLVIGLFLLSISYVYIGGSYTITFRVDDYKTGYLLAAISNFVCVTLTSPANRGRFLRRLNQLLANNNGDNTQEQEAALVSALIGSQGASTTLANATDNFRGLPLGSLTREELAKNEPDPEMNKKTIEATLGSVDAFASHSWSDAGDAKFDILQEWAGLEKKLIWLDKVTSPSHPLTSAPSRNCIYTLHLDTASTLCALASSQACIDQTDIDKSLACLPVFLAGCRQLLVLAGPTYASRLWVSAQAACIPALLHTFDLHPTSHSPVRDGNLCFRPHGRQA